MPIYELPNTFGVFLVLEIFAAPFGYEGAAAIMSGHWKRACVAYAIALPLGVGGLLALGLPIFGNGISATIASFLTGWLRPLASPYLVALWFVMVLAWMGGDRFVQRIRAALSPPTAPVAEQEPLGADADARLESHSEVTRPVPSAMRPSIVYDGYDDTPNQHGDGSIHRYTHLRFCNGSNGIEARDVAARIEFLTYLYPTPKFLLDAKWRDVDFALERKERRKKNIITMLPNGMAHHLDLVARPPESNDCYGLHIDSHPNYQQEQFRVEPGAYKAKVTLSCRGFEKEFWFRVTNYGAYGDRIQVDEFKSPPIDGNLTDEFNPPLRR